PHPQGRAAGRPARHRQDAAGSRRRRRGRRAVLHAVRLGVRRNVRRCRRLACPRPVRAGQGEGALHHLHRRAGRHRHVARGRDREAILRLHARTVVLAPGVDLAVIAARTPGFAGADLANIVNEAALLAARKEKNAVEMADFEEAIDRVVAGLEKKSRVLSEKERDIVAHHEMGHALVATSIANADPVHKVTIIPRGVAALGMTYQLPTEDRFLLTRSEIEDRIAVLLGGRVAEELVYGEISTGAHNDLERATELARLMATKYGTSERV